jgi:hypothetical protein
MRNSLPLSRTQHEPGPAPRTGRARRTARGASRRSAAVSRVAGMPRGAVRTFCPSRARRRLAAGRAFSARARVRCARPLGAAGVWARRTSQSKRQSNTSMRKREAAVTFRTTMPTWSIPMFPGTTAAVVSAFRRQGATIVSRGRFEKYTGAKTRATRHAYGVEWCSPFGRRTRIDGPQERKERKHRPCRHVTVHIINHSSDSPGDRLSQATPADVSACASFPLLCTDSLAHVVRLHRNRLR